MKSVPIYIILIFTLWTCTSSDEKYFVGQNSKVLGIAGTHYLIGQVVADSIQLWTINDDVACGCYFNGPSKTIPLRLYSDEKFSIKELNVDNITVAYNDEIFTLRKKQKLFHKLRNELTLIQVDRSYEDSIKNILQVRNPNNLFLTGIVPIKERQELVSSTDSRTFKNEYSRYLDGKLADIKAKAINKKRNYQLLTTSQVTVDSIYFQSLLLDYSHSYYDQKSIHYILTTKPELYYTIEHKTLESDICCCETCFTHDELEQMYCTIKPLEYKKRFKDQLWPFEHHGNFKCVD